MTTNIHLPSLTISSGKNTDIELTYEVFGQPLHSAPIVLVNHALTGNSTVAGEQGWWKQLIHDQGIIDTQKFTVLCFNIPGNGYNGNLIEQYKEWNVKKVASLFLKGLEKLKINQLHSIVGGSLGGAIAWEMAYLQPTICQNLIVIATDFISTDWVISQCYLQELILKNSENPVHDARVHAMLLYRTPNSLNQRFKREQKEDTYLSEDWLDYHGKSLEKRFTKKAYLLMNHLIKNIHVCDKASDLKKIQSHVHIMGIDSDLLFTAQRNRETYNELKKEKNNVFYHEIKSIHGHDAFLMEYDQLNAILQPLFKEKAHNRKHSLFFSN